MTINQLMQQVSVTHYTSDTDQYGQLQQTVDTTYNIYMALYILSQTNVTDPRYVQCDMLGLVDTSSSIVVGDTITADSVDYSVQYIMYTRGHHYKQVFLQRV